jgi:hypothetical protein
VPPEWDFRQLYINGKRGIRAREPNLNHADVRDDYKLILDWEQTDSGLKRLDGNQQEKIFYNFPIVGGDVLQQWQNWGNYPHEVEFVNKLEWTFLRFHVADVEDIGGRAKIIPVETGIVDGGHYSHKRFDDGYIPDPYYFFENARVFLNAPGEWYLDRHQGVLYYMPRTEENMANAVVTAPDVERLLQIQGGGPDLLVHNVQFHGITFEHSNWTDPSTNGFFNVQGDTRQLGRELTALAAMPGAVHVQDAANVLFERNIFRNLGATAMLLYSGVSNSSFIRNVFQDIAAGGISLEGRYAEWGADFSLYYRNDPLGVVADTRTYVHDIVIKNNYFTRIAQDYWGSMGIFSTFANTVTVEHNEFFDLPQTAISIGTAGWKYSQPTYVSNNIIRYNKVENVMNLMSDGAGIYVMSNQPNSMIFENHVLNLTKSPVAGGNKVMGIYLDHWTGNYTVQNNVVETIENHDGSDLSHFLGFESFCIQFINRVGGLYVSGEGYPVEDLTPCPGFTPWKTIRKDTGAESLTQAQRQAIRDAAGIEPAYQGINLEPVN